MHRSSLAGVVVAVVAAGATLSTADAASFSGKVCSLLTAKQGATVRVAPLKCTAEATVKTAVFTAYHGYWGTNIIAAHPSVLTLAINTGSAAYLRVAANATLHALGGKKVTGIGGAAYESSSGTVTEINFTVDNYICSMSLRTPKPPTSTTPFNTLAKAVAGQL